MTMIPRDAREVYLGEDGEPIAYCPADSIGLTDIRRGHFLLANWERMQHFARRWMERGAPSDVVLVCIDVDDPTWTPLVDALMPGHDWEAIRARGEHPVARGLAGLEAIALFAETVYPAVGDDFGRPMPLGTTRCAIFAAGGVSVVGVPCG